MTAEVLCPICNGKTHYSRDTGDFICDRCGKIVVRASINKWIPGVFDIAPSVNNELFIFEGVNKEVTNFVKAMTERGWQINLTKAGHYKTIWPYAPKGKQIIFMSSTPSDKRAMRNAKALVNRMESLYPAPNNANLTNDDVDPAPDPDDINLSTDDFNPNTASTNIIEPHCQKCQDRIPFTFTQKGSRGNIYNIISELNQTLRNHDSEYILPNIVNDIQNSNSYQDALNIIKYHPLLKVVER